MRKFTKIVFFSVSPETWEKIKEYSQREALSVSAFIRHLVVETIKIKMNDKNEPQLRN